MPKELVHFFVAKRAARKMAAGPLARAVATHPRLYLLGSVLPDTPLYGLFNRKHCICLASALHGADGEDSFLAVKRVIRARDGDLSPGEWALVLGALCHVMADAVFHPWVMYRSGRGHVEGDEHREGFLDRHRSLETWMDLALLQVRPRFRPRYHFSLWDGKEMDAESFYNLAGIFFGPGCGNRRNLAAVFACHSLLQRAFFSRSLGGFLWRLNRAAGVPAGSHLALFYPKVKKNAPRLLAGDLDYFHPVTGRPGHTSFPKLLQKAVVSSVALFDRIQRHVRAGTVESYLSRIQGPSLETGLPGVGAHAMRHLDPDPDIRRVILDRG
ncbi:MAG: zinc dependent phospholipase C family protein [Proteobacteria bacterium]|nr:zinc dependent phospholipase C family protein [Pseudomonadota bacterium]